MESLLYTLHKSLCGIIILLSLLQSSPELLSSGFNGVVFSVVVSNGSWYIPAATPEPNGFQSQSDMTARQLQ
jgi:hypothetical protein